PGLPRLEAIVDAWIAHLRDGVFPGGCFVTTASVEYDARPGPLRDDVAAAVRRWLRVLEAEASHAREAGDLPAHRDPADVAFELDRAAGRRSTHLVAPPGSGKTVIGLEIVRRLARPALVLAPTATIQSQWSEKLALFTDTPSSYTGDRGPLHVLTYQSICQ